MMIQRDLNFQGPKFLRAPLCSFLFILLSLALLGHVALAEYQPCTGDWAQTFGLTTETAHFEVDGFGGTFVGLGPGGTINLKDDYTQWIFRHLVEMTPTVSSGPWARCWDFTGALPDPWDGTIHRSVTVQDELMCQVTKVEKEPIGGDPTVNVTITSQVVDAIWPAYPSFHFQLNLSKVDGQYTLPIGPVFNQPGRFYNMEFKPNTIKISLSVEGWPWAAPANTSYLTILFQGYSFSSSPYLTKTVVMEDREFVTMESPRFNISQEIDHFIVIDGQTHTKGRFNNTDYYYSDQKLGGFIAPFHGGISSCIPLWDENGTSLGISTGVHFSKMSFDPTLSALFLGNMPGEAPAASPAAKAKNMALLVGAPVGIIGAVAVIATIVILAIYVPKVRYFFRPYSKPRQHEALPASDSAPAKGGWTKGAAPH